MVRAGIKPQLAPWYDSLPYGFSCQPGHRGGIGVLQLARGERNDFSFLIDPDEIRKNASLDVGDERLLGLVDRIRAETGDESGHDRPVFLGSHLIHSLGPEFGKVRARDELRKIAIPVEHENAFRIGTPAVALGAVFLHIERRDKGPGSDDLLFERFSLLLCESSSCNAGQHCANQHRQRQSTMRSRGYPPEGYSSLRFGATPSRKPAGLGPVVARARDAS